MPQAKRPARAPQPQRGERERPQRGDREQRERHHDHPPEPRPGRAPQAGAAPGKPKPSERAGGVRVGATGNAAAELVDTVPISSGGGAGTVVMSLAGGGDPDLSLPDLRPGDRLEVYIELEVTTDLEEAGAGLVGTPYSYAPEVTTTLELSGGQGGHGLPIGKPRRETVDHEQHHRVIVREEAIEIPGRGLPWDGPSRVDLIVEATSPEAARGNVLLIGQNEPDGRVLGDMGQISALRVRRGRDAKGNRLRESQPRAGGLPVEKGTRTVVLSQQLDGLMADEQLRVRAQLETSSARLGYPARITTRVFLADSPDQDSPGGTSASVASFKGQVTKANGFNCTPDGRSSTSVKVGVLRMTQTPAGPLYLNVVAVSADPFKRGKPGDVLEVTGGSCEVVRFDPELLG